MSQLPFYKKLLGYFIPVRIKKDKGTENPHLELLYFRGRYQLATVDALYSDGIKYRPLSIAIKKIKTDLRHADNVLVLGTGLGSAVEIMLDAGYQPKFTLVDYDKTVLKWAMEHLSHHASQITPVCADGEQYMKHNKEVYDIVVCDIFYSRIVPDFVTRVDFLEQCRKAVGDNGYFVLNYIVESDEKWIAADAAIRKVFPTCFCVDDGLNRIVIAKV